MSLSEPAATTEAPNEELSTNVVAVHELISNSSLNIPEYQRPYTWNTHNILSLIEDIQRFSGADLRRLPHRVRCHVSNPCDGKLPPAPGPQKWCRHHKHLYDRSAGSTLLCALIPSNTRTDCKDPDG